MVEVPRKDDDLVATLQVRAAQHADDIVRLQFRPLDRDRRLQACRQREARYRLGAVGQRDEFGKGMSGSGEQFVGVRRIHHDRDLLARRLVERRVGE